MRQYIFPICITLFLLFSAGTTVLADTKAQVRFKDITLISSDSHLLLFAMLDNNDPQKLIEALHSGIPMQFTFQVELTHIRENWTDEDLRSMQFVHTLKYDTLKERYHLQLEEQHNRSMTFTDLSQAMDIMYEINGLKVVELTKLIPDSTYKIRIKASLYEKTLPMNLHYIIPFISLGNVETDWHNIEFRY